MTSYTYDPVSRLASLVQNLPGTGITVTVHEFEGAAAFLASHPPEQPRRLPNGSRPRLTDTALYPSLTPPARCTVPCWRPAWHRDALNRQTGFLYNASGQPTRRTDPADAAGVRRTTYVSYETVAAGASTLSRRDVVRVCGTGGACGTSAELRTEYDHWGTTLLPSAERRISGGVTLTTTYSYDDAGRPLVVDGPLPGSDDAVYNRYDEYGRRTWEIGARGSNGLRIARRHTYRASDDRVTRTETGTLDSPTDTTLTVLSRVDYLYDGRRNPVRETVVAAGTTYTVLQRTFDESNRLECEAVRMNPAAFGSLPASACSLGPEGIRGPDRIARNLYDAAGQLLTVQRAYGTPLQQDHARYEYSSNGRRTSVTDANGNRAELRYDGFDRLSRWIFPSAATGAPNPLDYEEYAYDLAGNRTSLRKRDGSTIRYEYDRLNRVTRKTVPERAGLAATHTRDVFYAYDVRDLMTDARFDSPAGEGVHNVYDGFGRLTSSRLTMNGVARTLLHDYDAAGNRTGITYPGGQVFTYAWDAAGRLGGVYEGAGTTVPRVTFEYGPRGLPASRSDSPGSSVGYTYNPLGWLTGQTDAFVGGAGNVTVGLSYNVAGQIVSRTRSNDAYASNAASDVSRSYTVNGLNQYTAAGPPGAQAAFGYDANGNLSLDPGSGAGGTTTFTYDVENRLVAASGARSAGLRYDPLGRLYEVTGPAGTTRFLYDGDALVAEYNAAGTTTARYVHGAGADDPLLWSGGGTTRWLHADHQGSIVAVTTGSGAISSINAYDEWGIPNAANVGRFQYTGQAWIAELGMYHYKARIYSPTLGRFLQVDPVGYDDQINLYAYVGNDPMNGTDPSGEVGCGTRAPGADSFSCPDERDNSFRNALAVAGAAAGGVIGAGVGGGGGAAGGAIICSPGGPAAIACAGAGGTAGAIAGGTIGAGVGGAIGGLIGEAIDRGIAVLSEGNGNDSGNRDSEVTRHGQQRQQQARSGDTSRQIGDPNRIIREGRVFRDTQTGASVYVRGDRVVIVGRNGRVSQFRNPRANTQQRIRNGRWVPNEQ